MKNKDIETEINTTEYLGSDFQASSCLEFMTVVQVLWGGT